MGERVQIHEEQSRSSRREEIVDKVVKDAQAIANQQAATAAGEVIRKSLDALIDEVDAVLHENAEEFVKHFVQRGGE